MTSQISSLEDDTTSEKTDIIQLSNLTEFLKQEALIEKLTLQVKALEDERDAFKKEADHLRRENTSLKEMVQRYK